MTALSNETMMRQQLELQSSQLERALHFYKVRARVTGGVVSPRWVDFELQLPLGQRVNRVLNLADELALALDVPELRIRRNAGRLHLQIPRDTSRPVSLLTLLEQPGQGKIPPATALLGLAENGRPLLLRFPSPDVAHVLVAGTTGSGKTVLLQSIALSLAWYNPQRRLQMALIDPKRRGFQTLDELPHLLADVISEYNEAADLLSYLVDLMEQRDREQSSEPTIVVLIDELADLLQLGGRVIGDSLLRLAQRGRQAGIHLVCGTQKPSARLLGPLLVANFPVRLVGKVVSADDARVAAGIGGTGAEKLGRTGDFLAIAGGQNTRFQAAFATNKEVESLIETLWERINSPNIGLISGR